MKKMIVIILICLLSGNISGAGISYHYCCNFFQSLSIDFKAPKARCRCGDSHESKKDALKKKSCCKTKHQKVTIDESKTLAKQLLLKKFLEITTVIPPTFNGIYDDTGKAIVTQFTIPPATSPPFVRSVPIHILHQQFLI